MSKTYRRKNGYRFWRKTKYDFSEEKFSNQKEANSYFESDRFDGYGNRTKSLKNLSKKIVRANERKQLHKIIKSKNDIHLYDDSFEESSKRFIIYCIF